MRLKNNCERRCQHLLSPHTHFLPSLAIIAILQQTFWSDLMGAMTCTQHFSTPVLLWLCVGASPHSHWRSHNPKGKWGYLLSILVNYVPSKLGMHVCARVAVQDILHTGAQTFSVFPEALIRTCSAQFTTFLIRIIMFCWKKVVHTSILKCLLEQLKFYVCFVFGISHSSHQGLNGVGATSGCLQWCERNHTVCLEADEEGALLSVQSA